MENTSLNFEDHTIVTTLLQSEIARCTSALNELTSNAEYFEKAERRLERMNATIALWEDPYTKQLLLRDYYLPDRTQQVRLRNLARLCESHAKNMDLSDPSASQRLNSISTRIKQLCSPTVHRRIDQVVPGFDELSNLDSCNFISWIFASDAKKVKRQREIHRNMLDASEVEGQWSTNDILTESEWEDRKALLVRTYRWISSGVLDLDVDGQEGQVEHMMSNRGQGFPLGVALSLVESYETTARETSNQPHLAEYLPRFDQDLATLRNMYRIYKERYENDDTGDFASQMDNAIAQGDMESSAHFHKPLLSAYVGSGVTSDLDFAWFQDYEKLIMDRTLLKEVQADPELAQEYSDNVRKFHVAFSLASRNAENRLVELEAGLSNLDAESSSKEKIEATYTIAQVKAQLDDLRENDKAFSELESACRTAGEGGVGTKHGHSLDDSDEEGFFLSRKRSLPF